MDGSGKETQSQLLYSRLTSQNLAVKALNFPAYNNPSSSLVKLYLQGKIGTLDEVNIYAATSFYAADRYITYQTDWSNDYRAGKTLLADRYMTSNIIYQMPKLPHSQWEEYLEWLLDYEFDKLKLPEPDVVLYLDVTPEVSQELLNKRYKGDSSKKDIHEQNFEYLKKCRQAAFFAADRFGWHIISCDKNGAMLSREEIAEKIDTVLATV